jgi:hypothetical protein
VKGATPQTTITTSDGSYSGKITWSPSGSTFAAGTVYAATVTLTAGDNYKFSVGSISKIQTGTVSGISVSGDGTSLQFQITFPSTEKEQQENTGAGTKSSGTTGSTEKSANGKNNSANQTQGTTGSQPSSGSSGNAKGGASQSVTTQSNNSSSASSSQSSSSSTTSDTDTEDATEVTAFTLASDESMTLTVNVDELDINSVEENQEAEVTLDAIEDQTFTGTVTKVSTASTSSSGGVAKYAVEISIPKEEEMKIGMNASATIVIEKKENVVTIPVSALQEKGDSAFVYTQKDGEGNLSGEVEVTTGLSDGSNVEITDGLSEGTTVYYQKTGAGSESGENIGGNNMEGGFDKGNSDGFGNFGGGGGDMPQGGGPGQGGK